MKGELSASRKVAPSEVGESLAAMRLFDPEAQQQMQLSLSQLGQLTPIQVFCVGAGLELVDGFKRVRAARDLSWPTLRAEVQSLDTVGAKVRLLRCNAHSGLSDLEQAWVVHSLYRDDKLSQPQIARLLGRDKSWACRRLALAEGLSDELTASVRLGLVSATAAVELARLQRCNQDEVARQVVRRGLTTRQISRLVDALVVAPPEQWSQLLEQTAKPVAPMPPAGALPPGLGRGKSRPRRTPGEQLVADAWAMKRLVVRLHARLLERSLRSLGEGACAAASTELIELRAALGALTTTLDLRLREPGATDAAA